MKCFVATVFMVVTVVQPAAAKPADATFATRTVLRNYIEGWLHGDAEALGHLFASNGDFISPDGLRAVGRAQVTAFYAAAFRRGYAGSHATFSTVAARFLRPDVIVADGVWTITGARKANGETRAPERGIATAVLVHVQSGWASRAVARAGRCKHHTLADGRSRVATSRARPPRRVTWRKPARRYYPRLNFPITHSSACASGHLAKD